MVHQRGFEPPRREARAPQARVSTVPPLVHFDNLKAYQNPIYEVGWNYTTLSLKQFKTNDYPRNGLA